VSPRPVAAVQLVPSPFVGVAVGLGIVVGIGHPLHVKVQSPFLWFTPVPPPGQVHVPIAVAKHCSGAQAVSFTHTALQAQLALLVTFENCPGKQLKYT